MTRELSERLMVFALPFALYGLYVIGSWFGLPLSRDRRHPWMWLTIAGLSLFALSFIVWRFTGSDPVTGTYVAPHMESGHIVPGYVVPKGR